MNAAEDRIAALETALETLSAEVGRVPAIAQGRAEQRRLDRQREFLAIHALGDADRSARILAMPAVEMTQFGAQLGAPAAVQLCTGMVDAAVARVLGALDGRTRVHVEVAMRPPVARVAVRLASRAGWELTQPVYLTDEEATALDDAGVEFEIDRARRPLYNTPLLTDDPSTAHIERVTAWEARLEIDGQLRAMLEAGKLIIEPLSDEQSRACCRREAGC